MKLIGPHADESLLLVADDSGNLDLGHVLGAAAVTGTNVVSLEGQTDAELSPGATSLRVFEVSCRYPAVVRRVAS